MPKTRPAGRVEDHLSEAVEQIPNNQAPSPVLVVSSVKTSNRLASFSSDIYWFTLALTSLILVIISHTNIALDHLPPRSLAIFVIGLDRVPERALPAV
jgi:hypothetical protein